MDADSITLVENGCLRAVIVVGADAGRRLQETVRDMVRVIAKMSGAALPVAPDGQTSSEVAQVHIGRTSFAAENGLIPQDMPINGYRIVSVRSGSAPKLLICGTDDMGVSHGVYSLLTRELGVVWGMASPLFEEIPARKTIAVGPVDRTESPAFGFCVAAGADPIWVRRNMMDENDCRLPYCGHGHNLYSVVNPEDHSGHPEYFALIDGERKIPPRRDGMAPQPCLTHPDVIRLGIDAARRFFEENPDANTFSLCPNDSPEFCQCPTCAALDAGAPEFRGRTIYSDSYFHFVDAVAKEVLETHPDRFLSTYAYWITEPTPRQIDRLPPNVVVYLTQESSQYFDPEFERVDRETMAAWQECADHLAIFEYYGGLGWLLPRSYPGLIARTLPYLSKIGVVGFFTGFHPYWAHMAPMLHVASRLLWDLTLDPVRLVDDWLRAMFREAAPQMKAFYDYLDEVWKTPRAGKWFNGFDWIFEQCVLWPEDKRKQAWLLIDAAQEAATASVTRERVDYVRRGHRVAYLLPRACELAGDLAVGDEADLEQRIRDVSAAMRETLACFHADVEGDPTYSSEFRSVYSDNQFLWMEAYLGDCVEAALAGHSELRDRLVADDALLARMLDVRRNANWDIKRRIGWAHTEFAK